MERFLSRKKFDEFEEIYDAAEGLFEAHEEVCLILCLILCFFFFEKT